jgi:hypothetical protein
MMTTMIMGRKMLQTVLFVLGLLAVAIVLPHSTVDATTLDTNGSSLRRRPTQKVRGVLGRDLATGAAGKTLEDKVDDGKGGSKSSKSGGAATAIRPTRGASLGKINEGRETPKHGTDITVNSHSSNANANESSESRKSGRDRGATKNNRNKNSPAVENGVEHFQEGKKSV